MSYLFFSHDNANTVDVSASYVVFITSHSTAMQYGTVKPVFFPNQYQHSDKYMNQNFQVTIVYIKYKLLQVVPFFQSW